MSELIGKLAPTTVVAAVALWCCWPYLGEAGARLPEKGDLAQIADSLLSPIIKPAPDRDPFWPSDTVKEVSTKGEGSTAPVSARKVPGPEDGPEDAGKKFAGPKGPRKKAPKTDVRTIVKHLTLNATYIQGSRRFALIDGRVYGQGEALAIPYLLKEPCIVAQICAYKVLIRHRDRTVELSYRNPIPKPPQRRPVGAAPRSGGDVQVVDAAVDAGADHFGAVLGHIVGHLAVGEISPMAAAAAVLPVAAGADLPEHQVGLPRPPADSSPPVRSSPATKAAGYVSEAEQDQAAGS